MRVQFWIECLSVSITILGGMFIAATPLLLMLIFAVPDERLRDFLRILVFSSFLTAFLLIGVSGFLGNLYYYYDHRKQRFRFMMHCGSGPKDHYFGDSLFADAADGSTLPPPPTAAAHATTVHVPDKSASRHSHARHASRSDKDQLGQLLVHI